MPPARQPETEREREVAEKVMGWKVHHRNTAHWMKASDDLVSYRVQASTCGYDKFNPFRNVADDYQVLDRVRERFGHTLATRFQKALAEIWVKREDSDDRDCRWHIASCGAGWQYEPGDYAVAALAALDASPE